MDIELCAANPRAMLDFSLSLPLSVFSISSHFTLYDLRLEKVLDLRSMLGFDMLSPNDLVQECVDWHCHNWKSKREEMGRREEARRRDVLSDQGFSRAKSMGSS